LSKITPFIVFIFWLQVLIGRATSILKKDIDNLPFPDNLDIIRITEAEKLLINDVMSFHRKNYRENAITNNYKLTEYIRIFCKTLNSIYKKNKSFQLYKVIDTGKYYALHFEYTSENLTPIQEKIADLEQYIEEAIPIRDDIQQKIHIQRIIKAYGQDSIILAKPKQLRYWLPSIALRDADETFADYIKSRY